MSTPKLGTGWRLGAGGGPGEGPRVTVEDTSRSVFDELAVPGLLHIEQLDARLWWVRLGEVTLHVRVRRDGRVAVTHLDGEMATAKGGGR